MTRHLLKLVWNRKRTNGLIIVEIFLSFLVCFLVLSVGLSYFRQYVKPLGFRYDDVWYVSLRTENRGDWIAEQAPVLRQAMRELESTDGVLAVAGARGLPYDGNRSVFVGEVEGRELRTEGCEVSVGFHDVFRLDLVRGRWFEEADRHLDWRPAVIDMDYVREGFGDEDPIGKPLPGGPEDMRVVGVVSDYRKAGELSEVGNFRFTLNSDSEEAPAPLTDYAILLASSIPAEFEERLIRRIEAIAPQWTVEVHPLERTRRTDLRMRIVPMLAIGVVAMFLLLMVALGLIGVLWQNVTQRTREIGLRRASGAHRGDIHRQILVELLLMTTLGVALGAITAIQLPLLQVWGLMTFDVVLGGIVAAMVLMYLLATLCGLYPSWMATRVQPAEALHYE